MTREEERTALVAAQAEAATEQTVLEQLTTLGDKQGQIFAGQHKARMLSLAIAGVGLLVAGLLGVILLLVVFKTGHNEAKTEDLTAVVAQLKDAQAQIKQVQDDAARDKTQARHTVCNEDNKKIDHLNALLHNFLDPAIANPAATDQQRVLAQKFLDQNVQPYRDCTTDSAIAAYYAGTGGMLPSGQTPTTSP